MMEEQIVFMEAPWGKIPDYWRVSTIKEEAEVVTDYVANGSFASLAENVKYRSEEDYAVLIRLVDYNNQYKGGFVFIDKEAYDFLGKSKLYGDEIIISNVGANVGTVFKCPRLKYRMSLAPNAIMVKFKTDDNFYYYWLKSQFGQYMLQSIVTGSAQPKFNKTNFRDIRIPVPPIEEQRKISAILSSIDDKIEVNQRINDNLELQTQELLKSWKEEVKGGAHYSTKLETIASFYGGYSYKGKELKPSRIAMATIKNFNRNGGFKLDGYKEIVPSDKVKPEHFATMFDILVAHTDLTQNAEVVGNAEMILGLGGYESILFSMDLVKVEPKKGFPYKYLLAALLRDSDFKTHCMGYVNGTTVLHMSKKALPDFEMLLPMDRDSICSIDSCLSVLYKKMAEIVSENSRLEKLRDMLLPRLMSGELNVNELTN